MKTSQPFPAPASDIDWAHTLHELLSTPEGVHSLFQPIVDVRTGVVKAYEALTRFRHPTVSVGPDVWFRRAASLGLSDQLETLGLTSALAHRDRLAPGQSLHVNIDPGHLNAPNVSDLLDAAGDLTGLVIELTDHRPWDWQDIELRLVQLRHAGATIAVDHPDTTHSALRRTIQLRPSMIKLDHHVVQHVDADPARAALVEMIAVFAKRIDATVIAQGVERRAEAEALLDLGVDTAQGWFFAGPGPAWVDVSGEASQLVRDLKRRCAVASASGPAVADLAAQPRPSAKRPLAATTR